MKTDFSQTLRNRGLKATSARIAVLKFLQMNKHPVDVVEILAHLNKEAVEADQATVYRILNKFVDTHLIRKVEFLEGKFRYESTSLPHHHHAICSKCGRVEDIENCDTEALEKTLQKKMSFSVQSHSLEFFGLCSECK